MTFMKKFLDALRMDGHKAECDNGFNEKKNQIIDELQSKIDLANKIMLSAKNSESEEEFNKYINELKSLFVEYFNLQEKSAYNKYYDNINKQKENNLNIKYDDVKNYDNKPFDLSGCFISDEHFTAIELSGNNLEKAYSYLREINHLLLQREHLYEDTVFPDKINTEYMFKRKLPISHLRLMPYTATMRKSKYPLCLWLSNIGEYGTEYIYAIYFDRDGNIGQGELSLHGKDGVGISYETKIRRDEKGLYILRISKTLYSPPYGTTTIYHHREETENRHKIDNEYDLERYARECNAYIAKEERNSKN